MYLPGFQPVLMKANNDFSANGPKGNSSTLRVNNNVTSKLWDRHSSTGTREAHFRILEKMDPGGAK